MSKVESATKIHKKLQVTFGPQLPKSTKSYKMNLCSLWVGSFILKKGIIPNNFDAIMIDDRTSIVSWLCCTSRK